MEMTKDISLKLQATPEITNRQQSRFQRVRQKYLL